jgi:uncharacterized protein (UPF0248 family)
MFRITFRFLIFLISSFIYLVLLTHCDRVNNQGEIQDIPNEDPKFSAPEIISPTDNAGNQTLSIELIWKSVDGAEHYKVQITSPAKQNVLAESNVETNFYYTDKLAANTTYFWRVLATSNKQSGEWSDYNTFTTGDENTVPVPVELIFPENEENLFLIDILFEWEPVNDSKGYYFQLSNDPEFTSVSVDSVLSNPMIEVSDLEKNTPYHWRVLPILTNNTGTWEEIRTFEIIDEPEYPQVTLTSPENNATNIPTTINFEWEENADAEKYHFQLSKDVEFEVIARDTSLAENSLQYNSLQNEAVYYWRVRVVDENITGEWSETWSFTTKTEDLPDLKQVNLSSPSNGAADQPTTLTFTWKPDSEAENYQIIINDQQSFSDPLIDEVTSDASFKSPELDYGTTYYWGVRALADDESGEWSKTWSFTTKTEDLPDLKQIHLSSPSNGAADQPTTLTFTWKPDSEAENYQIIINDQQSFSDPLIDEVTSDASFKSPELDYGTTYYWGVRALADDESGEWSKTWSFTTKTEDLPDLKQIHLSSPSNGAADQPTTLTFTWKPDSEAENYQIIINDQQSFSDPLIDEVTSDASFKSPELDYGTTYYWGVRALADDESGEWSKTWSFTTKTEDLPDLKQIHLSSPSNGAADQPTTLTFTWKPDSEAENYQIKIDENNNFSNSTIDKNITESSIDVNGLEYETTYYWKVRAMAGDNIGKWSKTWSFTTEPIEEDDEYLDLPAVTLSSPKNGATVEPINPTFNWQQIDDAEHYQIRIHDDNSLSNPMIEESVKETSFSVPELEAGTTYFWAVRARAGDETSEWSDVWTFTTEKQAIPEMGRVTLSSPSSGAENQPSDLNFEWESMTGAENYRIMVDESDAFTSSVIDETIIESSFDAEGLEPGATYYWRVRAQAGDDIGEWSQIWSFTTESTYIEQVVLSSPSDGASNIPTSVTLTWQDVQNIDEYRVQLGANNSFSNIVEDELVSGTSYSAFGLSHNQTYYWRVRGVVGNETGEWSATKQFTTEGSSTPPPNSNAFVSTSNGDFVLDGQIFRFAGTNAYYLPNYEKLDSRVVDRAFNIFEETGITVIRMWAFYDGFDCGYSKHDSSENVIQTSPGVYSERALKDLDRVIAKGKEKGIRFILPLVNYWDQLGGICQYNTWAGASNPSRNMDFFINNSDTQRWFKDYIEMLLNRVNTVTGVAYKDEPAIFAWQIINEGRNSGQEPAILRDWYREIAQFIKSIDSNHMVSTGEEGFDEGTPAEYSVSQYSNTYVLRAQEGTSYIMNTSIPEIDFGSFHWYPGDWGFGTSVSQDLLNAQDAWIRDHKTIANNLGKPVILGEYGFAGWGDARVETIYDDIYRIAETINLHGSLLWQLTADYVKCSEFGGNICYPGGRNDTELYNRFKQHVQTMNNR